MGLIAKAIRNPKKALLESIYRTLSFVGHEDFCRFIILSRSRTGSNMLISFLNSHPNIRAEGEIFSRLDGRDYKNILGKVFAKQPFYIKAKGFKIFYYHPQDDKASAIWDTLISLDNLKVIHLKRANIFRTLISRKIAGTQDVWEVRSDKPHGGEKKKAVSFTVEELEEGFRQTREWEETGEEKFRYHPCISIYYEELVSSPEATFERVTQFLGLRYKPPKTMYSKQNPENSKRLVTNYEELKSAFSGTEWQAFFGE